MGFDASEFKACAKQGQSLVLSRTDSLGDVVLTLPLAGVLKAAYPGLQIIFLGTDYTRAVVDQCQHVDEFWTWNEVQRETAPQFRYRLETRRAFGVVHVFPRRQVANAFARLGLPFRLGTSRRWYHWLTCTNRPALSRRHSDRHEAQLNIDLMASMLPASSMQLSLTEISTCFGLRAPQLERAWETKLATNRPIWIVHPLSKGSARNYPLDKWMRLVENLLTENQVVVTGTESERQLLRPLLEAFGGRVVDAVGKLNLTQLLALIGRSTGLIAASTGPLHLAAALGRGAIGLYPPIRPVHPGRWGPLGPHACAITSQEHCTACTPSKGSCPCMNAISLENIGLAVNSINKKIKKI